jgi:hypothetical protein
LSLQANTPLPGHPKTLRDFTAASELLTLPSSFGAIQLGETFSSCLCVNNEAHVDIDAVTLKVEMQTVTSKVMLAEFGGSKYKLKTGDTLENLVNHEIKELGQHVLACTVTYRLPPNARSAPGPAEDASDPSLQIFRKFYKFAVILLFVGLASEADTLIRSPIPSLSKQKCMHPSPLLHYWHLRSERRYSWKFTFKI